VPNPDVILNLHYLQLISTRGSNRDVDVINTMISTDKGNERTENDIVPNLRLRSQMAVISHIEVPTNPDLIFPAYETPTTAKKIYSNRQTRIH
jgi:hypothetical protein